MASRVTCPFCAAESPDLVSLFGSQLLLSQYRCTACRSYFEGVREDRWTAAPIAPGPAADPGGPSKNADGR